MRLIDADAMKEYIDAQKGRPFIGCTVGEALKIMTDEQPTVEAKPVRHGRWKDCTNHESVDFEDKCSVCGYTMFADFSHRFRYCPNCGARMEEENNDTGA